MDSERTDYLKRKKEAFDVYDSLDEDDNAPDPGREASQAKWKKIVQGKPRTEQSAVEEASLKGKRQLRRSQSDITAAPERPQPAEDPFAIPSSSDPRRQLLKKPLIPSGLRKSVSELPPARTAPRASAKQIRGTTSFPPAIAQEAKLFSGLHFYFFPNNDTHPARRMRITKSIEHGAKWEKTWNPEVVTHVVMDNSMSFAQLTRFLKLESIPPNISLVSEKYTADCIAYRSLLDPSSAHFSVNGFQAPQASESESTDKSLQLKPASKSETARKRKTPPKQEAAKGPVPPQPGVQLVDRPDASARVFDSFGGTQMEVSEELDKAIAQAKALEHVPLDDEEGNENSDNERKQGLELVAKRKNKVRKIEDKFQCMQKHTGESVGNLNEQTINILQAMADYYEQVRDEWRPRAYRKAISTLRNHPVKVCTKAEAHALPNIGERLATKIEEIATTNQLRRLQEARAEPGDQILQTFMKVYGAGIVQATKWVDEGYTTLDELIEKAPLTDNQRIGIEHYEDFNSRIPREEVARHGNIVRNALRALDPAFEVIVGGSYRRGAKDSGDIDCIITRPNTNADHLRNVVLGQLVPQLTASGFLVASLAITSRDDGSKWHGASCLPDASVWRRIDFLLVPSDEVGAALIYFTGNDIFNRSLRLLASTKGMRLNQRGLYKDVIRGPGRQKLTEGELVEGKDEKKIFEALGVPWRPPEHRIC